MKKTRISVLVLALVMALGALTGCSLFKPTAMSLSKETIENLAGIGSFTSNVKVDYEGPATVSGASMDLAVKADFDLEAVISSGVSHAKGTVSTSLPVIGDINVPFESYQQAGVDGMTAYANVSNTRWIRIESKPANTAASDGRFDSKMFLGILQKIASGDIKAELAKETEMMGEREAYRMDVSVSGALLDELYRAAAQEEGETADLPENLDLTGADTSFVFYIFKDTKLPAKIFCNCTALGNAMLQQADTDSFTARADKLQVTMEFTDYDTIDALTIPEDVTASAVDREKMGITDFLTR